ncbi:hypothetical protein AAFX91_39470 [Bradyrhizobium sp. 31Argb]|uniref:hypothetical protein n=1 Tax=Bradyrhizobium TaxID=374 RepID=UPI0003F66FB1|nr:MULTISPECIES: hypothetical protein [Bradyrhizobium]
MNAVNQQTMISPTEIRRELMVDCDITQAVAMAAPAPPMVTAPTRAKSFQKRLISTPYFLKA